MLETALVHHIQSSSTFAMSLRLTYLPIPARGFPIRFALRLAVSTPPSSTTTTVELDYTPTLPVGCPLIRTVSSSVFPGQIVRGCPYPPRGPPRQQRTLRLLAHLPFRAGACSLHCPPTCPPISQQFRRALRFCDTLARFLRSRSTARCLHRASSCPSGRQLARYCEAALVAVM